MLYKNWARKKCVICLESRSPHVIVWKYCLDIFGREIIMCEPFVVPTTITLMLLLLVALLHVWINDLIIVIGLIIVLFIVIVPIMLLLVSLLSSLIY